MSFILDALKKSEAERQKQTGPTLLELRITQPRRRYPLWALCVGALLAINVLVLLVLLLRRAGPTASAAGATPLVTPVAPARPASTEPAGARTAAPSPAVTAAATGTAAAVGASTPAPPLAAQNPADYEPAVPASAVGAGNTADNGTPAGNATLRRSGDYTNLPSLSELGGSAPTLQLDLLVNSDRTSDRYALINMRRVHEGDVLPDGTRVLAITRSGVAMEYRGQQFMLKPGGTVPAGNN